MREGFLERVGVPSASLRAGSSTRTPQAPTPGAYGGVLAQDDKSRETHPAGTKKPGLREAGARQEVAKQIKSYFFLSRSVINRRRPRTIAAMVMSEIPN